MNTILFIIVILAAFSIQTVNAQQQFPVHELSEETIERLIPTYDNATIWIGHLNDINKACILAIEYIDEEDVKICINFYEAFNEHMKEIRKESSQMNKLLNVEIPYPYPWQTPFS
jgi:hypothetical protein